MAFYPGFDYGEVRRHRGIAFYPYVEDGTLKWRRNPAYEGGELIIKDARTWEDFSLEAGVPVYTQFQKDKDRFLFVADLYSVVFEQTVREVVLQEV